MIKEINLEMGSVILLCSLLSGHFITMHFIFNAEDLIFAKNIWPKRQNRIMGSVSVCVVCLTIATYTVLWDLAWLT